jgi:NifU-like protein involved in Fe-S cluster formation
MKQTNNLFAPANATHPIQDNLGQIIMAVGFSKLEYASILLAGHIYTTSKGEILPETIANESIEVAIQILEQCEEKVKELEQEQKQSKILNLK